MISWHRYEEIKTIISELFEDYLPKGFPLNIFGLAKSMGIMTIFASEILKSNNDINDIDIYSMPPALLLYSDVYDCLVMYIDDIGCSIGRQRFGAAHEIGHIILGHEEQNAQNEEEANYVATYLLVPTSLVLIKGAWEYMTDPLFIYYAFDVSIESALFITTRMENRLSLGIEPYEYETIINKLYEKSLLEHIHNFIKNK